MRFIAFCLVVLMPMQAAALSCLPFSVSRTFKEVKAAPQDYVVVAGRLTLDTRDLPKSELGKSPALTRIKGRLMGKVLDANGYRVPFDQRLTLEVACFGPWCGAVENGQDVLAFVRRDGSGQYALAVSPCNEHVHLNPKQSTLKTAARCAKGLSC